MADPTDPNQRIDEQLKALYGSRYRWWGFKGGPRAARLYRECVEFLAELRYLVKDDRLAWVAAAYRDLDAAVSYLQQSDVDGGWFCLHAARRYALKGLEPAELELRATILRAERQKLSTWRATAVDELIPTNTAVTAEGLMEATRLRDEGNDNLYQKIVLTSEQLQLLLTCPLVLGFLLTIPIVNFCQHRSQSTVDPPDWGWVIVSGIMALGILGSTFSVVQSIITDTAKARIPERVANKVVTLVRSLLGSVSALAGYAFYSSNLVNLKVGNGDCKNQLAVLLSVAFVFGYTGEKLIAKVADNFGAAADNKPAVKSGS